MSTSHILLIVFSGLGVVHGLFLAILLWLYKKGNIISNKILSLLLLLLSFRVGKSVILEFNNDIDVKLIFVGLATLMAIGPLFYLYTLSQINKDFQIKIKHGIHFIPAVAAICFGIWMNPSHLTSFSKTFYVLMFVIYYGHFLIYLLVSFSKILRVKDASEHSDTSDFLKILFYALLAVWMVYVLNLFDEVVPYVVGPVLYTLIAYLVTFIVIQKGYLKSADKTKYRTTPVSEEQIVDVFNKLQRLLVDEKQFKNENISLKSLSKQLKVSSQVLSMVINTKTQKNFNAFINQYRIEESIKMFHSAEYENHTIASIAFEVGFNSISSFNTAFKKQTGITPLSFRKTLVK